MEEYLDSSDSDNSLLFSSEIESSKASEGNDLVVLAALRNKRNCIETYFKEVIPKYTVEEFMIHFRVVFCSDCYMRIPLNLKDELFIDCCTWVREFMMFYAFNIEEHNLHLV
ncbi:unnamed protein product, partial [Ceratitis capitata]